MLTGLGEIVLDPREFSIIGTTAIPARRLSYMDTALIKKFLEPHRGVKADKQAIRELKQYLGANTSKDTDALRRKLRNYYLTNAAIGTAGAAGVGGAGYGYGVYKTRQGGEKKAAEAGGCVGPALSGLVMERG